MKRFVLMLLALSIFSAAFAMDWLWEVQLEHPALDLHGDYATEAVSGTLYLAYFAPADVSSSLCTLYFCKSSETGQEIHALFSNYACTEYPKPNLIIDLPDILVSVNFPDLGIKEFRSFDGGSTWEMHDINADLPYFTGLNPIIKAAEGQRRSFGQRSLADSIDTMYYLEKHKNMHDQEIFYNGRDILNGIVKIGGDIHLKNTGQAINQGWPLFNAPVYIGGDVIRDPDDWDYPNEEIFQGGLMQDSKNFANLYRPFVYDDFRADAQPIGNGTNTIVLMEMDGNIANGYIGTVTYPSDMTTDVWSRYPYFPGSNSEYLFDNHFAVADTIWTPYPPILLPDKLFVHGTLWLKGTVSGVHSIGCSGNIYTIGDILLTNTLPGANPAENTTDKLTLLSEKQILLKYGYKDPATGEHVHPNCRPDDEPIYIYADLIAMNKNDSNLIKTGMLSFEYQHPHPSVPAVNMTHGGDEYYFDNIDLHRYPYPQIPTEPWPQNIDYPWYNPLWPEARPYLERGTAVILGAVYQNVQGFFHRSLNDSEYPSNSGVWDIENDFCGGPSVASTTADPYISGLTLGCMNYPNALGSGIGYKKVMHPDPRIFADLPRRDIWNQGAIILDYDEDEPAFISRFRVKSFTEAAKSVDYHAGNWLYHLGNSLYTDLHEYPFDLNGDWQILQARLLADGNVLTLEKSLDPALPAYRVQYSSLDGESGHTVYSTDAGQDSICLSRIGDGFLYPVLDFASGSINVLRFDLFGNLQSQHYNIALPLDLNLDEASETFVVFDNPSEGDLHTLLCFRNADGSANTYHKFAYLAPVSVMDELQSPPCHTIHCYPNPFQGRLNISLETDKAGAAKISIYNIRGQKVRDIPLYLAKGENQIAWDGKGNKGEKLSAGIYFIKSESAALKPKKIMKMD